MGTFYFRSLGTVLSKAAETEGQKARYQAHAGKRNNSMQVGSSTFALTVALIISPNGFFSYLIVHSYILVTVPAGLRVRGERKKSRSFACSIK